MSNDKRQVQTAFLVSIIQQIDSGEDFDALKFQRIQGLDVWRQAVQYAYDGYKSVVGDVEEMYEHSVQGIQDPPQEHSNDKQRVDEREENRQLFDFLNHWEDKSWVENQGKSRLCELVRCAVEARKLYKAELEMLNARLVSAKSGSGTK